MCISGVGLRSQLGLGLGISGVGLRSRLGFVGDMDRIDGVGKSEGGIGVDGSKSADSIKTCGQYQR